MNSQIAIAICTYRRPALLRELLISVERAVRYLDFEDVTIIVVDNDPEGSARGTVNEHWDMRIQYFVEVNPGIVSARNKAVVLSAGSDVLIFVDDDETVSQEWLRVLLDKQATSRADVVAGPVHHILSTEAPGWLHQSGIFAIEGYSDGSRLTEAACGNVLFRRELFNERPTSEWFQEDFNLTGGEDAELTRRLFSEGAVIVWAGQAHAYEVVTTERQNLRWIARRYRRTGGVDFVLSPPSRFKVVRGIVTGLARMGAGAAKIATTFAIHRQVDGDGLKRLFRGIGFVEASVRGVHREYRRTGLDDAK